MDASQIEARKTRARTWFETLRDDICAALEAVEDALPADAPLAQKPAGRFTRTPWSRTDHTGKPGGGGVMSLMRGRVFEKVGVHCSTVHGEFAPEFRKEIPGAAEDPRFWASGISLIAHPQNPHVPAVHMNTRFVVTSKAWFGGGADLTPVLDRAPHAKRSRQHRLSRRHALGLRCACHRSRLTRNTKNGATNISSSSTAMKCAASAGFSTTIWKPTGMRPSPSRNPSAAPSWASIPDWCAKNFATPWSEAEREEQLIRRGRYVEFNLLYDRGTIFGLRTGGNVELILSSMPPVVKWP